MKYLSKYQYSLTISMLFLFLASACNKDDSNGPDTLAPTVSLVAGNGIAFTGQNLTLAAFVTNEFSGTDLAKVEFFKGSTKLGEATSAPFTFNYLVTENEPGAAIDFTAKATDKAGNSSTSAITQAFVGTRVEAESGMLRGLAIAVNNPTASGGQKVGAIDNPESGIDLPLNITVAGTYIFKIAAGTDFNDVTHLAYIDGDTASGKLY
ncbi:MAG: Ig-like domain-containing protein, partial [Saprospiraceae bacterium]|nr:Ig-like domain-containing protein [Saprospiraceae bacterium]